MSEPVVIERKSDIRAEQRCDGLYILDANSQPVMVFRSANAICDFLDTLGEMAIQMLKER